MKAAHLSFAILIFTAASAHAQFFRNVSSFESAELKAGKIRLKRIAAFPDRANIVWLGWTDRIAPDQSASEQVARDLWPVVTGALGQVGFSVDQETYSPDALDKDQELNVKIGDLQKRFAEVNSLGEFKQKEFEKLLPDPFREAIVALHPPAEVEAVAVTQIDCTVETKAKKWLPEGPGGHTYGGCNVRIGLIDSRTGVLIYIARFQGSDDWTKNPEKVAPHLVKSFEKFTKDTAGF